MTQTIDALNEFEVVEKPKDVKAYQGKYEKLFLALKNLANDKSLSIPLSYIGETKFLNWLTYVKTYGKKHHGMKLHAILENGIIKAFRR